MCFSDLFDNEKEKYGFLRALYIQNLQFTAYTVALFLDAIVMRYTGGL